MDGWVQKFLISDRCNATAMDAAISPAGLHEIDLPGRDAGEAGDGGE
jgi:hypothetical protein